MTQHNMSFRTYHDDIDLTGVMYHSRYLTYMERARSEWFASLGFDQAALISSGHLFAVTHVNLTYRAPARFQDQLQLVTQISKIGGVSLTFDQQVLKQSDASVLCIGEIKVVCLNRDYQPHPLPDTIIMEIKRER